MPRITVESLMSAVQAIKEMDRKDKEAICDEIFCDQPNLLAAVLVLTKMAVSPAHVEVVLEDLTVMHLALKESDENIQP
jgi:hypothetical protein